MKSFAIDLYLWVEEMEEWMLVPAAPSSLGWPAPPGISQSQMLSSSSGFTFRVDDVLWLGNERDGLPLTMAIFGLERTLHIGQSYQLLTKFPIGEHLSIEIRQGASDEQVLVSRLSTRVANGYLERTATTVGTYYKDFAVDSRLWRQAVSRAFDGLALAFAASPKSKSDPETADLAEWLFRRHEKLT